MIRFIVNKATLLLAILIVPISFLFAQESSSAIILGSVKAKPIGEPKLIKSKNSGPAENIHCGIQDRSGNIWFGTTGDGVYRYDGSSFFHYTTKEGLNGNTVWSILEDRQGKIWLGTNAGICRYDGNSLSAIPITISSSINFLAQPTPSHSLSIKNDVWSILQDKTGKIWFGTTDGLYCYDGKKFSLFIDQPGLQNSSGLNLKSTQCMSEDQFGNIWFGSGPMAFEGITKFDGKTLTNFKPKKENWIRQIFTNKTGELYFTTRHNGLLIFNGADFVEAPAPRGLHNELLNTVLLDKKGNTWYGSDYVNDNDYSTGGVWNNDGKNFKEFTKQDGIKNTAIFFLLEDKKGDIWLGTRKTELFKYDGKNFTQYSQ